MVTQTNGKSSWAERIQRLRETIDQNREKIFSGSSSDVDQEQYVGLFFQAIAKQPKLLDCTIASLIMGLTDSATLGLPINSMEGDGYLVPRSRSVKNGNEWQKINEAQFQAGYLGKLKLAYESPLVAGITVEAVREGDNFKIQLGTTQEVTHEPKGGSVITGIYAVMWLTSGCRRCVYWTTEQIQEHAKAFVDSKTLDSSKSAWKTNWRSMACKTVLLNLLKYAPVSDRARRVMQSEEYADAGVEIARPGLRSGDTAPTEDLDALAESDDTGFAGPPSEEEQRKEGLLNA